MSDGCHNFTSVIVPLPPPAEDPPMDFADVAKMYGVKVRTVQTWKTKKLIPYHEVGRTVRFFRSELLAHSRKNRK